MPNLEEHETTTAANAAQQQGENKVEKKQGFFSKIWNGKYGVKAIICSPWTGMKWLWKNKVSVGLTLLDCAVTAGAFWFHPIAGGLYAVSTILTLAGRFVKLPKLLTYLGSACVWAAMLLITIIQIVWVYNTLPWLFWLSAGMNLCFFLVALFFGIVWAVKE